MLGLLHLRTVAASGILTAVFCSAAFSFTGAGLAPAYPETPSVEQSSAAVSSPADGEVIAAAAEFVRSLSAGDAGMVWMYASEEEQAAFGTEDEVLTAFVETYPVLSQAQEITAEKSWQEGDTPFIALSVRDGSGDLHRVTLGLWLDDAGDWKVVSCEVTAYSDRMAAL